MIFIKVIIKLLFAHTVFDDKATKVKSPNQQVPTPPETGRMYFLEASG